MGMIAMRMEEPWIRATTAQVRDIDLGREGANGQGTATADED